MSIDFLSPISLYDISALRLCLFDAFASYCRLFFFACAPISCCCLFSLLTILILFHFRCLFDSAFDYYAMPQPPRRHRFFFAMFRHAAFARFRRHAAIAAAA